MNLERLKLLVLSVLGLSKFETKDNKVQLTEDHRTELNAAVNQEDFAEKFEKMMNAELAKNVSAEDAKNELADAKEELQQLLARSGIDDPEAEENPTLAPTATEEASMKEMVSALEQKITGLEANVRKLSEEAEDDIKAEIIQNKGNMKIAHSKTHLFASNKEYNSFANRPWNKRAAGLPTASTEWTGVDIAKINEDFGAYFREERDEVMKILKDYRGLPSHWPVINNVDDKIAYASVITGEVTQARKKSWLPKNKNKFAPVEGQIFPVQIDLEWTGNDLQKIETSWMNKFNQEGSQPYKWSFVRMLLEEILMKAREEDKNVLINGIHVPTADDETTPQSFMYRGNGLLKIISKHINKVYKPFAMGKPTTENIIDYVEGFGERLPVEINTAPLDLYMSRVWVRRYIARKKVVEGLNTDYNGETLTIDGFPNINIEPLDYLDGTDFMFLTTRDNIAILQNIKSEESFLNVDTLKRDIFIYGDYKLGIHVMAFGMQWEDGEALDTRNQLFWSNDVDIFPENVYAPIAPDDATPSAQYHTVLQTGVNTGATAITSFDDVEVGQYLVVRGNGTTNASTIANAGEFDLTGAITLSENVEIVLYVRGLADFVEISRSTLNEENEEFTALAANATTADAANGTLFLTSANTGATAITNIANAVEGEVYTIRGGSDTNATTIAASGNFSRISAGITLEEGNEIVVRYNGSKFVELSRVVA